MKTRELFGLVEKKLKNIRIKPNTELWDKLMLFGVFSVNNLEDSKIDNALNNFFTYYQKKMEEEE